jgi:hypothetical protein
MAAGGGDHLVAEGECIFSIAAASGHAWRTIWDDPANAAIRAARGDPGVLAPGDHVAIPPRAPKKEPCESGREHRFVRKGAGATLRLALVRRGKPQADAPYTLTIEGEDAPARGRTDAEGRLTEPIPAAARRATLVIGEGADRREIALALGALAPLDATSGVEARLRNLGFDPQAAGGLREALLAFQRRCGLAASGEADAATRDRLRRAHGT